MDVFGNKTGLSASQLRALERIYRRRVDPRVVVTPELARSLCEAARATGRQVGALVHRSGHVDYVVVGDAHKLMLPDLGRLRAASGRFRGLRLIHTHLRGEPLTKDDLVDLTRLRLDLVAALEVLEDGQPGLVHVAHVMPGDGAGEPFRKLTPVPLSRLTIDPQALVRALQEEFARLGRDGVRGKDGRAILVHVCDKMHAGGAEESMRELCELARSAGVGVADTIVQVRDAIDPRYILGKGKLEEVMLRAMQLDVEVLIFDRELAPKQAAAIEEATDLRVLDRSQLILDIFAQRAESRDGKLQVELAQMKYLLPRLALKDDALSRLTGGIGGRGPGETKLEIGRRRARERVHALEGQLEELARQRRQRRRRRDAGTEATVAVVGYTNAGKSTLVAALTGADLHREDLLFATLDTRSRRARLRAEGRVARQVVVTDTVGFVRDMPEHLFAAFRATFEEAGTADVLIHVLDASDPSVDDHVEATERVLVELGLEATPRIRVLNKIDRALPPVVAALARQHDAIAVSAIDAGTLGPLVARLLDVLARVAPVPALDAASGTWAAAASVDEAEATEGADAALDVSEKDRAASA
ncbi:MAG: GTPase HflX [Deltaproteobacteria bacterium]|nr:GTPase HflX [Deltaproteobacteria bacterium]